MRKMKMMLLLAICFTASTVMSQGTGGKMTVTLLSLKADTLTAYDGEDVYYGKPGKNGKFTFNLKPGKGPRDVSLIVNGPQRGRLPLFMDDNYNLDIVTNMTDSASFSGAGANEARVFNQNYWFCLKAWRAITGKGRTPDDMYNDFDAMFRTPKEVLLANKDNVSPVFYKRHYNFLYYQEMGYKLDVPFWYKRETGKKLSESIPSNYWDIIKQLNLNGEVLKTEEYNGAMTVSLPFFLETEYKYKSGRIDDTTFSDDEIFRYVYRRLEELCGGQTRNYVLKARLEYKIGEMKNLAPVKPLIDEYVKKYSTPENAENIKELEKAYAQAAQLAPGNEPPAFIVKDKNGKEVSLKDFKGKVLYMDFWASWCAPCRQQMKLGAPKLHKMFENNKDVVFLYVNLDKAMASGEKAIAEDNIQGTHVFAGDFTPDNPVARAFNISGIPRYVIIGKDGTIFDVDAPRPTDENTPARLREALNAN